MVDMTLTTRRNEAYRLVRDAMVHLHAYVNRMQQDGDLDHDGAEVIRCNLALARQELDAAQKRG